MSSDRVQLNLLSTYLHVSVKWPHSEVPIKRVGPNKRVGWIFYVNFLNKDLGPNKREEEKSIKS